MKCKYKSVEDYMGVVFRDYKLTDLSLYQNKKKKGVIQNYSVYSLLHSFLEDFGVFIGGNTNLYNLDGTHSEDFKLIYSSINLDFPLENESILRELYGYKSGKIDIGLFLPTNENCGYSFMYNLENFSCQFFKHFYGRATSMGKFNSLQELIKYLKETYE